MCECVFVCFHVYYTKHTLGRAQNNAASEASSEQSRASARAWFSSQKGGMRLREPSVPGALVGAQVKPSQRDRERAKKSTETR